MIWAKISFWLAAILFSVFWGIYGMKTDKEEVAKNKQWIKNYNIKRTGIFISEFFGSMAGWICLWILIARFQNQSVILNGFDVFLGTVVVICIPGFSYQIVGALGKK